MKSILLKPVPCKLFYANTQKLNISCIYITSKRYCNNKSIYQRDEEGRKPRTVFGKPYPEWRKPWIQRDGEFTSKLALFNEKNPSPEILNALQKLPYLTFEQIKEWWQSMKVVQEIQNQKYIPKRVATLGSNLAAVHFFAYRQAAVKLKDSHKWIKDDVTSLELPNTYQEGYYVEAVDCSNFHHNGIRYEGLQNLHGLNFLKWLSLKNQLYIDSWCLDRIAGQNGSSLEYLDISSTKLDVGCVFALARMPALKMVIVLEPGDDVETQAALSYLEQEQPQLVIKVVEAEKIPETFSQK